MNDLTPPPCMKQEATGGSPTTQVNIKSAAGPNSDCRRLYSPNSLVVALTKIIRTSIRLTREYEREGNASEAARLRDNINWYFARRRRELEGR